MIDSSFNRCGSSGRRKCARGVLLTFALVALCGCEPFERTPVIVEDVEEVADHRIHSVNPFRGVDVCVDPQWSDEGRYLGEVQIGVFVDTEGRARLLGVAGDRPLFESPPPECVTLMRSLTASWSYRPFVRDGRAVNAELVETVIIAPNEAWRASRRSFPDFQRLSDVRIVLERGTGFFGCQGRGPYTLELDGEGTYTVTELQMLEDGSAPQRVRRSGSIDVRNFEKLVQHFRDADFFSMRELYAYDITDQGAHTLTISVGFNTASVFDYVGLGGGMPSAVIRLQDEVDRVAGLEPWQCGRGLAPFIQ